jgi:hypothetical protein
MSRQEWEKQAEKGTSSDMVWNILASWKKYDMKECSDSIKEFVISDSLKLDRVKRFDIEKYISELSWVPRNALMCSRLRDLFTKIKEIIDKP